MSKQFASQGDLEDKNITFEKLSDNAYAYITEGDPNSGVIIGDDAVMVIDTTATPTMAQDLIAAIRTVTDKPIRHVLLTHYHAVRVLGAAAFKEEGAVNIFASQGTYDLIVERGQQDMDREIGRFPRLFRNTDSIPGLTWPNILFEKKLVVNLGNLEVHLLHLGSGHTKGDTIAWIPSQNICFSGDLVEYNAGVYAGDAYLEEWPSTLDKLEQLGAEQMVPGRGPALKSKEECQKGIEFTRKWVTLLYGNVEKSVGKGLDLKSTYSQVREAMDPVFGDVVIYDHVIPFDVSRAYDEAKGIKNPRIWTAERDLEMWAKLNQ